VKNYLEEYMDFYSKKNNLDRGSVGRVFYKSMDAFEDGKGWNGEGLLELGDTMAEVMQWKYISKEKESSFYNEDKIDFRKMYIYMQDLDLMRMLSYSASLNESHLKDLTKDFVINLRDKSLGNEDLKEISIVDYGCGLAYWTISICKQLTEMGIPNKLTLVDINRESFVEFLDYLCKKRNINYEFIEVKHSKLVPELPKFDYAHIMAVLEHTSEPEEIVEELVEKARHGAVIFGTFYDDPFDDFEHISYDLSGCREILENNEKWDITNVGPYWNEETTVYQILKPNESWN
tara:strand:- start:62 stop:931 length:870 start_codon:yes stop_codon:yes gene_type:complete